MKKTLSLWLPPFLWALVIFGFSSLPTVQTSEIYWQDFVVKKTAHLIEYAILGILLYRALRESGLTKARSGFFSVFAAFLYGLSDEFHQGFTPGREPRVRDAIIDTVGASLSVIYLTTKF